jgi:hypothetical protein
MADRLPDKILGFDTRPVDQYYVKISGICCRNEYCDRQNTHICFNGTTLLELSDHRVGGIDGLRVFALALVEELNKNPALAEKLHFDPYEDDDLDDENKPDD